MANLETEPLLGPPSRPNDGYDSIREQESQEALLSDVPVNVGGLLDTAITGRRISWASAYMLVISRVIGTGIFAMPGAVLQDVGSPGLAILLWVVGAGIAGLALVIDIEYGCMLPRSGGFKVYLEYTYPKPRLLASCMAAVYAITLVFTASNCIVFSKYLIFAAGVKPSDLNTKVFAAGLLTMVTVIHACFYKTGIWAQHVFGWLKLALIAFVIATGLFVVLFPSTSSSSAIPMESSSNWHHMFDGSDWSFGILSAALLKVFYAYAGLDNVNYVLNEVKNPIKTVRTVGPTALLTSCLMFILVNVAYFAVVPLEEIKHSQELVAALFFARVFGTGFGSIFLPIAIALCAAGNVMVSVFALSRLKQEIARRGLLPMADLLASSRPFGAPSGGLFIHWVPSFLVIVLPSSTTVYAFAAEVEGYAGQFVALLLAVGLVLLRTRQPELARPFKAWIPAVWLRILLCLVLIAAPLFPSHSGSILSHGAYALTGLAALIFGVVYWFLWTIALPIYGGYRLEDEPDLLADGTTVTKLVKRRK